MLLGWLGLNSNPIISVELTYHMPTSKIQEVSRSNNNCTALDERKKGCGNNAYMYCSMRMIWSVVQSLFGVAVSQVVKASPISCGGTLLGSR